MSYGMRKTRRRGLLICVPTWSSGKININRLGIQLFEYTLGEQQSCGPEQD